MDRNTRCPPLVTTGGNVIPFRARDQARARPGLDQVRFHAAALDRELQDLEGRNFRSAGEWAKRAATPIVRTDCITGFLMTITAARPAVTTDERCRQGCIGYVRDELRLALSDTARSLVRLANPAAGPEERREVLQELPLHRMRHQRILIWLHELIEEPQDLDSAHGPRNRPSAPA